MRGAASVHEEPAARDDGRAIRTGTRRMQPLRRREELWIELQKLLTFHWMRLQVACTGPELAETCSCRQPHLLE